MLILLLLADAIVMMVIIMMTVMSVNNAMQIVVLALKIQHAPHALILTLHLHQLDAFAMRDIITHLLLLYHVANVLQIV